MNSSEYCSCVTEELFIYIGVASLFSEMCIFRFIPLLGKF